LADNGQRHRIAGWSLAVERFGYAFAVFALADYWRGRICLDVVNSPALWILCFFAIEMNLLRFVVPVGNRTAPQR
jgi:hypothetical protein